jgi:hypothetical protein
MSRETNLERQGASINHRGAGRMTPVAAAESSTFQAGKTRAPKVFIRILSRLTGPFRKPGRLCQAARQLTILDMKEADMNRRFRALSIACLLIASLASKSSPTAGAQAPPPLSGLFRVTFTGFKINHQTYDDIFEGDGVGDEVTLIHQVAVIDNTGGFTQLVSPASFTSPLGQKPPNPERAGSGSPTGGLVTGDGHPTSTPWVVTTPIISGNPPNILFEGSITQRTNAVIIAPAIWEWDGDQRLQSDYASKMSDARVSVTSAVRAMIDGTRPLTPDSAMMPGAAVGIGNTVTLGRGFLGLGDPKNRPIGMTALGDNFGFTPKVIALTYDVARELARRDIGFGRGVLLVPYPESDGLLQGDYSLFLKIEDLTSPSATCEPIRSSFSGMAQLTTSHPDKRLAGPFVAGVNFDAQFTECRSVVGIAQFPEIVTQPVDIFGVSNVTTVRRLDSSAGSFDRMTGRLTMPITLLMHHSYTLIGDSTISLTLSTDEGAPLDNSGNITLAGVGVFRGGILDGIEGRIVVSGRFSPNPRL